jgi:D-proline reductase (dithiol) PrdB
LQLTPKSTRELTRVDDLVDASGIHEERLLMSTGDPVEYMRAIRERYLRLGYDTYRWYEADAPPSFVPLPKPISALRLGVLTTAGAYAAGQVAFHYKDDTSIRRIPVSTAIEDLRFSHLTENYLVDPRKDPGCVFPLRALNEAVDEGQIGELAPDAMSCMGGIYSQRRVREELAPAVADALAEQGVEALLAVPM